MTNFSFCSRSRTTSPKDVALLPRTGSPSKTVAFGQSLRISDSVCPIRLPSRVLNGTIVLSKKSYDARKVVKGDAIVTQQQGEPTRITSWATRIFFGLLVCAPASRPVQKNNMHNCATILKLFISLPSRLNLYCKYRRRKANRL